MRGDLGYLGSGRILNLLRLIARGPDTFWQICIVLGGLSVATLAARHAVFAPPGYIDADGLWPIMLVTDLLHLPKGFFWSLTASNGLFPDLLLISALKVAGVPDTFNFVGYFVVVALGLWGGLLAVLQIAGCGRWPASIAAWIVAGPALSFSDYGTRLAHSMLSPNYHQGSLILQLFALALILAAHSSGSGDRTRSFCDLMTVVLITIGTFSDRIILPQLVLPLALILGWVGRPDGREALARRLLPLALGISIGLGAFWLLQHCPLFFVQGIEASSIAEAIEWFVRGLSLPVVGWPFGVAAFVSLLLLVGVAWSSKSRPDMFFSFALVSGISCFLVPLLLGLWNDGQPVRYQLPLYFLIPAAALAWCIRWLKGRSVPASHRALKFGFSVALIATGVHSTLSLARSAVETRAMISTEDENLANALSAQGYNDVFAQYWDASPLFFASSRRSRVCPLYADGEFMRWDSDDAWCVQVYADLARGPDLVPVIGREMDWAALRQSWGDPIDRREIAGFEVWFYPRSDIRAQLVRLFCRRPEAGISPWIGRCEEGEAIK